MLADPQSITINGTAISMPRVSSGTLKSKYAANDGGTSLRVEHDLRNRARSLVRLDLNKIGADPLLPTTNRSYTAGIWLAVDRPLNGVGFSQADMAFAWKGFANYLAVAGFAEKILGIES